MRSAGKLVKKSKRAYKISFHLSGCSLLNNRTAFQLQNSHSVDAEQNDQQSLYAVYNQGKYSGIGDADPVKHHHGDDGKVPRARPIGSRNNDRKRTADKHYQRSQYAQVFGKPEAIEGNIKMEKIAEPDEERIYNEEGDILYVFQRHNAFVDIQGDAFHLLIEEKSMPQVIEQDKNADDTKKNDIKPDGGKQVHQRRNFSARLLEESNKHRHLQQKSKAGNESDAKHIDQPLRHDRPEGLGKRDAIVAGKDTATGNLANARNNQAGGIRYEYRIDAIACARTHAQRFQRQLPAPATKTLGQHAECQGKNHPPPICAMQKHLAHLRKIEVTIDPIQDKAAQN